ncbi:MAG: exopolysaccharide biosynthesis polyprenyl glycosylphosphotransferase [Nitriliruptorales bacterium]|nr:exopolysaccharide biosynthesis polyprenyl glycosylphosphotransferase [Nitriliruptorales bacterium]
MAQREDVAPVTSPGEGLSKPPLLARLNARGFRLLMAADAIVLFTTMAGLTAARILYFNGRLNGPIRNYTIAFVLFTAIFVATYYFAGAYERELRLGQRAVLPQMASLSFGAWLIVALVLLVTERNFIPLSAFPTVLVVSVLGVSANRFIARRLRRSRGGPSRVLLVGAPDEINLAQTHLEGDQSRAVVVGQAPDAKALLTRVEQAEATEVLLLSGRMLDQLYPEPLQTLENRGVGVLQRVMARDTLLGLENVREIAGMPFVALRTHTLPVSRARFKRSLELLALLLTAPISLPLTVLTALYIRLVAGRHVLFWQERVGREGRPFRMVKFRTMYPDAEEGLGAVLAKRGDPRVIRACDWLRATRLDELPQLWNVLRGEMSIVGPRPERPELTAQFEELIPGYSRRHEIPPGITGLAQIHGRYHTDPEYKLGHDLQYLVNWSPILDLQILLRTVWVVLARRV